MCHIFFIHSSVDGHWGCFHVLATVNSAAMNAGVYISFQTMFFSRYMPRSGIAGSYGSSIFSFLRDLHTGLHSGYIPMYIPTSSVGVFPSLHHPFQDLLFGDFLMIVILTGMRQKHLYFTFTFEGYFTGHRIIEW